jgi:hypothetical protein
MDHLYYIARRAGLNHQVHDQHSTICIQTDGHVRTGQMGRHPVDSWIRQMAWALALVSHDTAGSID